MNNKTSVNVLFLECKDVHDIFILFFFNSEEKLLIQANPVLLLSTDKDLSLYLLNGGLWLMLYSQKNN